MFFSWWKSKKFLFSCLLLRSRQRQISLLSRYRKKRPLCLTFCSSSRMIMVRGICHRIGKNRGSSSNTRSFDSQRSAVSKLSYRPALWALSCLRLLGKTRQRTACGVAPLNSHWDHRDIAVSNVMWKCYRSISQKQDTIQEPFLRWANKSRVQLIASFFLQVRIHSMVAFLNFYGSPPPTRSHI